MQGTVRGFSVVLVRIALALAPLLFTDCLGECAEEACHAARSPYGGAAIDQGIAGVVSYRTDSCVNDCCECSEAEAMLEIYPVTAPIEDIVDARAVAWQGPAPIRFMAEKRYERALDAGDYLFCTNSRCAPLRVARGSVTTANVLKIYGPTKLLVSTPDDRTPREGTVFSVE